MNYALFFNRGQAIHEYSGKSPVSLQSHSRVLLNNFGLAKKESLVYRGIQYSMGDRIQAAYRREVLDWAEKNFPKEAFNYFKKYMGQHNHLTFGELYNELLKLPYGSWIGSAGCVRLSPSDAKRLFDWVKLGDPVIVQ